MLSLHNCEFFLKSYDSLMHIGASQFPPQLLVSGLFAPHYLTESFKVVSS